MFLYGQADSRGHWDTAYISGIVFTRQPAVVSFLVRFDHRLTVIIYVAHVLHSLYTCPRLVLSVSLSLWCWDWESMLLEWECGSDAIVWWIIARANWCFNPCTVTAAFCQSESKWERERKRKHRQIEALRHLSIISTLCYTFTTGRHMSISCSFLGWTLAISACLYTVKRFSVHLPHYWWHNGTGCGETGWLTS